MVLVVSANGARRVGRSPKVMSDNCGAGFIAPAFRMNPVSPERRNGMPNCMESLSSARSAMCEGGGAGVTRITSRARPSSRTTKSVAVKSVTGAPLDIEALTTTPRSRLVRWSAETAATATAASVAKRAKRGCITASIVAAQGLRDFIWR